MSSATTEYRSPGVSGAQAPDGAVHSRPWLAAWTLARREWVRFIRQGNRVFGAIGQPLIFWALFSAILGPSFRMVGVSESTSQETAISYASYFFPGTLILIVLFTAIFTTISIIEDRREGFLQSVLVAPIPRWSMVAGKVLGGSLIALAHAAVFLMLGFTLDMSLTIITLPLAAMYLFIVGVALTSLGAAIAWRMQSTQGYHAIMMTFLLPSVSSAFAPPGNNWFAWVIRLNPLSYCIAMLRRILYWDAPAAVRDAALAGLPSVWLCAAVTLGFVVVTFALACRVAAVRSTGDAV